MNSDDPVTLFAATAITYLIPPPTIFPSNQTSIVRLRFVAP
jgi:hypothetical protein